MNVAQISSLAAGGGRRRHHSRRARRDADRWLRISAGRWEDHPACAWRAAELTALRERRILARSLQGVAREVSAPRATITAVPLNRRDLAPHIEEIEQLAQRLEDLELPVTAVGVLCVRDLLTEGGGPLYLHGRAADLSETLYRIRRTLEVN